MTEATATPEAREQVREQALAVVDQAKAITIDSDDDFEAAGRFLTDQVKAVRKEIDETFGPIVKAAHRAHREALAQKRKVEAPLIEAEKVVKGAIADYHRRQEEERRKEEARRRREARERAEEEALERAAELEDEGKTEEAEALIERPVEAAPTPAPESKPKAEGVSVRRVTKFRVTDSSKVDRKFLRVDETKIGQVVRSLGADAEAVVGGIEVYTEEIVAARAS